MVVSISEIILSRGRIFWWTMFWFKKNTDFPKFPGGWFYSLWVVLVGFHLELWEYIESTPDTITYEYPMSILCVWIMNQSAMSGFVLDSQDLSLFSSTIWSTWPWLGPWSWKGGSPFCTRRADFPMDDVVDGWEILNLIALNHVFFPFFIGFQHQRWCWISSIVWWRYGIFFLPNMIWYTLW